MTNQIHLRLPEKMYKEILEIQEEFSFSNPQEFIKESLRKSIQEYNKEKAIKTLDKYYGSVKNAKRLTKEDKEKIALIHSSEEAKKLTKEFNLK